LQQVVNNNGEQLSVTLVQPDAIESVIGANVVDGNDANEEEVLVANNPLTLLQGTEVVIGTENLETSTLDVSAIFTTDLIS